MSPRWTSPPHGPSGSRGVATGGLLAVLTALECEAAGVPEWVLASEARDADEPTAAEAAVVAAARPVRRAAGGGGGEGRARSVRGAAADRQVGDAASLLR